MNILIYNSIFLNRSETFVYNQINSIKKNNKVFVGCKSKKNQELFPLDDVYTLHKSNKKITFNKILHKLGIMYAMKDNTFDNDLEKLIFSKKIDLIHIHFGINLIVLANIIEKYDIPTVVTFHGFDASAMLNDRTYVKRIVSLLNKKNIYGITVSKYIKNRLGQLGVKDNKLIVHYIGVNVNSFKGKSLNRKLSNKIRLLQISRLVEKKGHAYTLMALREYINKYNDNIQLTLAGEGPLEFEIKEEVKKLGLRNYVKFIGPVNSKEVYDLMKNNDIFVQHSITADNGDQEGIPIVLMEAMAMNMPVVSTYHSGIPELVRNEIDGYLVKERDYIDYAEKIKLTVDNYDNLALDSRNWIQKEFNLDKNSEKLDSIYKFIIKNVKS